MKKWYFALLPLVLLLVFSGCNTEQSRNADESAPNVTDSESDNSRDDEDEYDEEDADENEEDDENVLKSCSLKLYNSSKPETVEVIFSGYCEGDIAKRVDMEDIYDFDYFSSSVVGLVGSPIEVTFDNVKDAQLSFVYDPDELRGMPETNFLPMYHSSNNTTFPFQPIDDVEVDSVNHTVTIPAKKD